MSGPKLHILRLTLQPMLQPMLQPSLLFPDGWHTFSSSVLLCLPAGCRTHTPSFASSSNFAALLQGSADFCEQHLRLYISHVASQHGIGIDWVLRFGVRAGCRGNAEKLDRVGAKYSAQA
jgi:hypothetical protein